jgi:hypothetical protein
MPLIRVQVSYRANAGNEDIAPTNTFWFSTTSLVAAGEEIEADLWPRLNTLLAGRIGGISQTGHLVKMYDMEDPEPRRPFLEFEENFTSDPADTMLPSQVSLCLSYQGAAVSGTSQARRRGRTYFGPFAGDQGATTGRPAAGLVTAMQVFGAGLLSDSATSDNYEWVVYSRVNDAPVPIVGGWVDNAWDIQRRRQLDATERTTFSLPG